MIASYRVGPIGRVMEYTIEEESLVAQMSGFFESYRISAPLDMIPNQSDLMSFSSNLLAQASIVVMGLTGLSAYLWSIGEAEGGTAVFFGAVTALLAYLWHRSRRAFEVFQLTGGGQLWIEVPRPPGPEATGFLEALQEAKLSAIEAKLALFAEDATAADLTQYLDVMRRMDVLDDAGADRVERRIQEVCGAERSAGFRPLDGGSIGGPGPS